MANWASYLGKVWDCRETEDISPVTEIVKLDKNRVRDANYQIELADLAKLLDSQGN